MGVHLELHVIAQPEGLVQFHEFRQFDPFLHDAFSRAGMGGHDNALAVRVGQTLQYLDKSPKIDFIIDIFFPVATHHEIIQGLQAQCFQVPQIVSIFGR